MKYSVLFIVLLLAFSVQAQFVDNFSDGDFTNNPTWTGMDANFLVNSNLQLQSNAATTSISWLFTPSASFDDAVWQVAMKIAYTSASQTTTSFNYASFYIVSDVKDLSAGCQAYYVQVGGKKNEVSLFVQDGTTKKKIIDGTDKRTEKNPLEIEIKITRDDLGNFTLYSKLASETDFIVEGSVNNTSIKKSSYVGLLFYNSSTTGKAYYFDNINVQGKEAKDTEKPTLQTGEIVPPHALQLIFSEKMNFSAARFLLDNGMDEPQSVEVGSDFKTIQLYFDQAFEKAKIYTLTFQNLTDEAGNAMLLNSYEFSIVENAEPGDLVWNEIMFHNPPDCSEYVEIYNRSNKAIDLQSIGFTTRKTDGSLNSLVTLADKHILAPQQIAAFTLNPDSVRHYYQLQTDATLLQTKNWYALNNEAATLVLCNLTKDTIFDELSYFAAWHHILIRNPQGVALERINPDMPTQDKNNWHSAASDVRFGTPGYKNSQYRLPNATVPEQAVWLEPEIFTPNNDGVDDVCFIHYKTEYAGFVANVSIFNPLGVKICQIANNALLANEGSFQWDGITARGTNAETGIYVLYYEIFQPETGKKIIEKIPLVVSSR
ncbi:MAG: hypothetical protein AUK44_08805 [Porphyromonadaceae bacterium CG2_30_38_12]|nr:MAG: hypothetical protein AUK44_08805 [Porphyromonadaceae bacterium CG2_30_38_12]